MNKKTLGLLTVLIVIIVLIIILSSFIVLNSTKVNSSTEGFNSTQEDIGFVKLLGPFGNDSSNVKIAYIVGVHPQENQTHKVLLNTLPNEKNLRYCYYIYQINVTQNIEDYEVGRMNGQQLAQNQVVPDVLNKNYSLVVDVHSNVGNWEENQFLFAPSSGGISQQLGEKIVENCSFLAYFVPPSSTSPQYVTLPIIDNGTPALIYEEFSQNPDYLISEHLDILIRTVDSLNF